MSTWIIPELGTDFAQDFEDTIIDYIYQKYDIALPAKDLTDPHPETGENVSFKAGFPDFFMPYSIGVVQTRTTLIEKINGKHVFETGLDVMIRMKRIERDAIDTEPELENMENEVQRIVEDYRAEDIAGIYDLVYDSPSVERVYNARDTYAKSDWRSIVKIKVFYEKEDTS